MRNRKEVLCALCGINIATTKEHIPPRGIFLKPRPSDLITVPSCFDCNNSTSVTDEKFRVYLGFHVARFSKQGGQLFTNEIIPTTRHNNRLRKEIINNSQPILLSSPSGIITGKGMAIPWDDDAHDKTIEKIIRGLFYYHYRKVIGNNADIHVHFYNKLPTVDVELYQHSIGNGIFRYGYNKVDDSDFSSIWIFNFYKGHFAGGYIIEKENA